jgi:hypothetical protein
MVYPRSCPLCEDDYRLPIRGRTAVGIVSEFHHTTARSRPGGTPSPWLLGLPGRLLTLRCVACRGEYAWDYFAEPLPVAGGRAGTGGAVMAEQRKGKLEVGARVRMEETGRTGTIREVVETRARRLYYVVHDRTAPEGSAPHAGEPPDQFGTYAVADTLAVLP